MKSFPRTSLDRGILIGLVLMLAVLLTASGCTQSQPATTPLPVTTASASDTMPNPASAACAANAGTVQIMKSSDGSEYGMCSFRNGTSCEEWALFRGEGCRSGAAAPSAVTATITPGEKKMVTFTESDNGTTKNITQGTRFAVELAENPTTGYQWNATVSPGLAIQSSEYYQDPASKGLMGAGGTRIWVIKANGTGIQKFSATYMRSWEPVTGNETAYSVNIQVEKA